MAIYINGIGLISPQETRDNNSFLDEVMYPEGDYFTMAEPPYKDYIAPRELRRMSKVLRNGLIAAKIALEESDLKNPDAILTGTGLGCATDTEKFLFAMDENKERLLTPTSFIQSTHNTLGGSIAIGLACHNYNMTYVNRGFSFESALLDAQLMIEGEEIQNALVGGFDEMTVDHVKLLQTTEQYHPVKGAKPGQGAGFFVLDTKPQENTYAQYKDLKTLYRPNIEAIEQNIKDLVDTHRIDVEKLVVIMGNNGIEAEEHLYNHLENTVLPDAHMAYYKHLSGEYYTSTAFAFWVACQTLKKQRIPNALKAKTSPDAEIQHVLIYNQFMSIEHSLILLAKC